MKLLLIFCLLILYEVNFISCKTWLQERLDEDPENIYEDPVQNFAHNYERNYDFRKQWKPEDDHFEYRDDRFNSMRRRRSTKSHIPAGLQLRSKRNNKHFISECTDNACSRKNPAWYAVKTCSRNFCTCVNGRAILKECPKGFIFNAENKLCMERNLSLEIGHCADYFKNNNLK